MTREEEALIENFVGTVPADATLDEAILNGEADAEAYGLSMVARRTLGQRIRAHFAKREYPR